MFPQAKEDSLLSANHPNNTVVHWAQTGFLRTSQAMQITPQGTLSLLFSLNMGF